jgi:hypothetical protein
MRLLPFVPLSSILLCFLNETINRLHFYPPPVLHERQLFCLIENDMKIIYYFVTVSVTSFA